MANVPMPGLERLLVACGKYPVRAELRNPWGGAPVAGELVLGRPFDPMLAAFYSRLGGLHLYLELFMEPCVEQVNGILLENEDASDWPEPFRSLLVFGRQEALAYRYATVPSLADAQGFQPVVEVDPYESAGDHRRGPDADGHAGGRMLRLPDVPARAPDRGDARVSPELGGEAPGRLSEWGIEPPAMKARVAPPASVPQRGPPSPQSQTVAHR